MGGGGALAGVACTLVIGVRVSVGGCGVSRWAERRVMGPIQTCTSDVSLATRAALNLSAWRAASRARASRA